MLQSQASSIELWANSLWQRPDDDWPLISLRGLLMRGCCWSQEGAAPGLDASDCTTLNQFGHNAFKSGNSLALHDGYQLAE